MVIQRAISIVWFGLVVTTILPSLGATAGALSLSGERLAVLTAVVADLRSAGLAPNAMAEWHVQSDDLAALDLGHAMGAPVRVTAPGAAVTQCSLGYAVAVQYQLTNPDAARVTISFRCVNPQRSTRQGFVHVPHYVVVRQAGGWSASLEGFEITIGPSGPPNFSMQPTAFGRG